MAKRKSPPTPTVEDIEAEAAYWDRPPEQVHADETRSSPSSLSDEVIKLFQPTAQAVEHFRAMSEHFPKRPTGLEDVPIREFVSGGGQGPMAWTWDVASDDARQRLTDQLVSWRLKSQPAEALELKGVRIHLSRLLQAMHEGEWDDRKSARERWRRIVHSAEPNLRSVKKKADPVAVAEAVDAALIKVNSSCSALALQAEPALDAQAMLPRMGPPRR